MRLSLLKLGITLSLYLIAKPLFAAKKLPALSECGHLFTLLPEDAPDRYLAFPGVAFSYPIIQKASDEFDTTIISKVISRDPKLPSDSSLVHDRDEVIFQSLILAISSLDYPQEITDITMMVLGAHYVDDLFDRPDLIPIEFMLRAEKSIFRGNDERLETLLGAGYIVAKKMLELGQTPERKSAIYRSIWRMLMGGLIQRASDGHLSSLFLHRYKQRGLDELWRKFPEHRTLVLGLSKIHPHVYWMTTKTALEEIFALENQPYNPISVELWNLAFAPLLYYQDVLVETKNEGLVDNLPIRVKHSEIIKALRLVTSYLMQVGGDQRFEARVQQLDILVQFYRPVLPKSVFKEYNRMIQTLEDSLLYSPFGPD